VSRFTDALELRLMEDGDGRAVLKAGRCQWYIVEPLVYDVGDEGSGVTIVVPAGATTDLASIPRLVTNILPPDGPWTKAAVVHDFLYRTHGFGLFGGRRWLTGKTAYTRAEADGVLREAMGVIGVPGWKRQVIWAAVRIGGAGGWGR
jgi:hypothetical protein